MKSLLRRPRGWVSLFLNVAVRSNGYAGVEREMAVMHQPHLVPPMKLTVWDELPPPTPLTAGPGHVFRWMSSTKSVASRLSDRTSFSIRRSVPSRPLISSPKPAITRELSLRRRAFRPLELSIYLPSNRLSDLPEFNRLSFTDVGEIKVPPRALLRTKSEEFIHIRAPVVVTQPKPASMFEQSTSHMRQNTCTSVISTSRPPSEYDALHSHPVSWASLPGLPPQVHMAAEPKNSLTILSPMQEEFTPPASSNVINDIVMDFPMIETKQEMGRQYIVDDGQVSAPSPKISAFPPLHPSPAAGVASATTEVPPAGAYFHTNYQTQKRISQWLANRSHSASISTVKTTSTTSSFAEHRRKRSQFYMLSANYAPPPKPLRLGSQGGHQRSMTVSTVASTVNTDIMSMDDDDMESMTTAPTASEIQSRSGTIKSVNTCAGIINASTLRPIVSGIPDLPGCYGEVIDNMQAEKEEGLVVIREINGPLRSPMGQGGVGLAF